MTDKSHTNPLAELADAYVIGAMEPAETEQFELRLVTDQEAREAVAAAVEMVVLTREALHPAIEPVRPTAPAKSWSSRVEWTVTVAGACLLFFVIAMGVQSRSGSTLVYEVESESPHGEFALIWGELITSRPLTENAAEVGEPDTTVDEFLSGLDEDEFQLSESPDWMLAAVGELSARDDMDHEIDMENR